MANTFEREGYDVTRLSTLGQAEATAPAVLPDVVLMEADWSQGSAIDACQNMNGQPKFRTATRIVILSRTTAPDFLSSAASAGVAEVIGKPVDMNQLLGQIARHAAKQFVAPPAEIAAPQAGTFGGQRFDVGMTMNDSQWALPMLRRLVEAGNINEAFIASIREEMGPEETAEGDGGMSSEAMTTMLRLALNRLVGSAPKEDTEFEAKPESAQTTQAPKFSDLNKGPTLGDGATASLKARSVGGSMEDILEKQAEDIADQVERDMDGILSEQPDFVSLLEEHEQVFIDPEALELTRLTAQVNKDLLMALQKPGALSDLTLLTQIEDATRMNDDVLDALPAKEEEE